MIHQLSRKVTIALVALVLFCTFFALFSMVFGSTNNFSFTTLWLTFLVMAAPIFIIGGVIVQFIMERFQLKPSLNAIFYTLIGAVSIIPYSAFLFNFNWSDTGRFMIFGAIAGILYFGVQYLFEQFFYRPETVD